MMKYTYFCIYMLVNNNILELNDIIIKYIGLYFFLYIKHCFAVAIKYILLRFYTDKKINNIKKFYFIFYMNSNK